MSIDVGVSVFVNLYYSVLLLFVLSYLRIVCRNSGLYPLFWEFTLLGRGGVVTIPACTAVRGGLLHIVDFSTCTFICAFIVRLAFAAFTTRGGRKTKEKYGEFSLYSWQKASVLNGNERLFVHCVSNNL